MRAVIDLSGQRFGRLTVSHRGVSKGPHSAWVCLCECGTITKPILRHNLTSGRSTSCGCAHAEATRSALTTHGNTAFGQTPSPEYVAWAQMWARCTNEKLRNWKDYGGRGITVCARWRDFATFLADMGPKPSHRHSLDRIDNHLGYSNDNCRWATTKTQSRNRRSNLVLELHGRAQCLVDWCEELNIDYLTAHNRLSKLGWTIERALGTPTKKPFKSQAKVSGPQSTID